MTSGAIVLRGAGGNFTAGGNVKGMKERLDKGINTTKSGIRSGGEFIMRLKTISKPTIAWIEGAVAGVGMSMAMACDFSIAEETAKMVFAFVNIGFVPDGGVAYVEQGRGTGQSHRTPYVWKAIQRSTGKGMGHHHRSCAEKSSWKKPFRNISKNMRRAPA